MSEWQPIETAPDDDNLSILVYQDGSVSVASRGMFSKTEYFGEAGGSLVFKGYGDDLISLFPTHWMPLPEPPQ